MIHPAKTNGGTDITAPQFRDLEEALQAADWKVDRKDLARQGKARQCNAMRNREGENSAEIGVATTSGTGGMYTQMMEDRRIG